MTFDCDGVIVDSSPTSESVAEKLYKRTTKGIKLGLDRMLRAADRIDHPEAAFHSIHVAGTNGKGSTCAYIESVLRAHGVKTGLFTSPHLVRFEERFIVDGIPLSSRHWMRVYDDLADSIEELRLTFFEAITLIAFELFRREKVDWAVIETGMGGRLDATNIVVPKVTAITALGLDHLQYLGNDLASIAREKLGIVKRNVPLVIARPGRPDILDLARRQCALMESPCIAVSGSRAVNCGTFADSNAFSFDGRVLTTPLLGEYQLQNAAVALETLKCAGFRDASKTADGIARTVMPGRFHIVRLNGRLVVFDVGHNPAAAEAFTAALRRRYSGLPTCMVVGIMKDKDITGVLRHYCIAASRLILTHPNIERAADCETLLRNVPADYKGDRDCIADVGDAVAAALAGKERIVCIAGSFHTVGEAMKALNIEPYGTKDAKVVQT